MALTEGSQAAGATPVEDQFTIIKNKLTGAGWTQLTSGGRVTAATAGTTAVVEVFTSPSTTGPVSSVYTGCILFFEVDETNSRLRVRCAEKYDSSSAGSPAAAMVKWQVPGTGGSTAQTPTANAALSDSFTALFQAAGVSSTGGYVEIPTTQSGFDYWVGATARQFIYLNTVAGNRNFCLAGHVEYNGTRDTTVGNAIVFLAGALRTATTSNCSWAVNTATTEGATVVRTSREPFAQSSGSFSAPFMFMWGGPSGGWGNTSAPVSGSVSFPHRYYSQMVAYNAWLHGAAVGVPAWGSTSEAAVGARSNLAKMPGLYWVANNATSTGLAAADVARHPGVGDHFTVDGSDCVATGLIQVNQTQTNAGNNGSPGCLLIKVSAW